MRSFRNFVRSKKGFTLVELLITIGIFVFMTALILAKYNSFNSGTLLTNMAYDMALAVRSAQTFSMSVMTKDSSLSFQGTYGVHFNKASTEFALFSDDNGYGYGSGDTLVSTYKLRRGSRVTGLLVGGTTCNQMSITFTRPYPDSIVYCDSVRKSGKAEITVSSADNSSSRQITVYSSGQIFVETI